MGDIIVESLKRINSRILLILFGLLITNTASFMVLPFLSLYLGRIHLSPVMIGVVLTVNVACQRGLIFVGGMLNDRFGERRLLVIGMFVRMNGYLLYGVAGHIASIIFASALVGLGGALFAPGLMSSIAKLAGKRKADVFALRNTVVSLGSAVGPILGGLLYSKSIFWVFMLTALAHFLFLLMLWLGGPKQIQAEKKPRMAVLFASAIKSRQMRTIVLLNAIFWFVYSQFNLTIPLYLDRNFHAADMNGILFTLNGIVVILFQYPTTLILSRRLSDRRILLLSFLLMAGAYLFIGNVPTLAAMFLFVLLFSTSEVLAAPTINNLVSEHATTQMLATYYGFIDIGWAAGATLGNLLGGLFFGWAANGAHYAWLWDAYALLCLAAMGLIGTDKLLGKRAI